MILGWLDTKHQEAGISCTSKEQHQHQRHAGDFTILLKDPITGSTRHEERVSSCSAYRESERAPLPGGSGLAGPRPMPPGPQSAAGQQWHHPAARTGTGRAWNVSGRKCLYSSRHEITPPLMEASAFRAPPSTTPYAAAGLLSKLKTYFSFLKNIKAVINKNFLFESFPWKNALDTFT